MSTDRDDNNDGTDSTDSTDSNGRALLQIIEDARTAVLDEGRPEAVERQHKHGKYTARERIATNFSLDASATAYEAYWQDIHNKRNRNSCFDSQKC